MIHIKVLKTNDLLSLGEYHFNLPRVYIGRSIHNNLIIEDDSIEKEIGVLKSISHYLVFETRNSYKVNSKAVEGIVRLEKGDILECKGLQIQILEFQKSEESDFQDYYKYLEKIKVDDPAKFEFIQSLEEHYITLTGKYDDDFLEK
ncbi:hypothetical protein M902_1333 [Bacteriovorax sp. BAL6_X]|uniref:hypothetical protein n=1 Tax=Bacteriovorax sp. BAL6_X TaxID=1201290 RepID=UPI0003862F53|nr:hypothetical protein [Bacteriovorax sp. BAL6_X]EPZ50540.1 hypothetical protein M902_1333 [Bacteriovorax sp. BAL6_X]